MKKEITMCDITKQKIKEKDIASEKQLLNLDSYFLDFYYFPERLGDEYTSASGLEIDKKIIQSKVKISQIKDLDISFIIEMGDNLRGEVVKKRGVTLINIKNSEEFDEKKEDGQCVCCGHIFKKEELVKDGAWVGDKKAQSVSYMPFFDWSEKSGDNELWSIFCNKCRETFVKNIKQKFNDYPDDLDIKEFIVSNIRLNKILQRYLQETDKLLGFKK